MTVVGPRKNKEKTRKQWPTNTKRHENHCCRCQMREAGVEAYRLAAGDSGGGIRRSESEPRALTCWCVRDNGGEESCD